MTVGAQMPVWNSGPKHLENFDGRLREYYEGIQLGAQVYLRQRWRVSGQFSYQSNYRFLNRKLDEQASGPGDLFLQGEYLLSATKGDDKSPFMLHRVFAALGVFIPTGVTDIRQGKHLVDADLQPGSGAYALIASADATLSVGQWGLAVRAFALQHENRV